MQALTSRSPTARQVDVVLIVVECCTIVIRSLLAKVSRRAKIVEAEWSYLVRSHECWFQVRLGAADFGRLSESLVSQPFRLASISLDTGSNVHVRGSVCGEGRKPPNHTRSLNALQGSSGVKGATKVVHQLLPSLLRGQSLNGSIYWSLTVSCPPPSCRRSRKTYQAKAHY